LNIAPFYSEINAHESPTFAIYIVEFIIKATRAQLPDLSNYLPIYKSKNNCSAYLNPF